MYVFTCIQFVKSQKFAKLAPLKLTVFFFLYIVWIDFPKKHCRRATYRSSFSWSKWKFVCGDWLRFIGDRVIQEIRVTFPEKFGYFCHTHCFPFF